MIWEKITSPEKRVKRALRKVFQDRRTQYWGSLGLTMNYVPVGDGCRYSKADVPTMATDSVSVFYNPDYVMELSEDECKGGIAHEIDHPAMRHRQRLAYLANNELANIAADYEENMDLTDAGLVLPQGVLLDWRFKGMNAEQIANIVRRENEQAEQEGRDKPHKPGIGGDMLEPTHKDGTPYDSEEKAELAERWEEKVSQALSAARKAGTFGGKDVPTVLQDISAIRSHVDAQDWRQPLRQFIDNLGSKYSTYSKLSRRALGRGQVLPGQKVIRPSLGAWGIDCSGSMDRTKNAQAGEEGQAALDDMAVDALDIIYTDTTVKDVDHYETGDTIKLRSYSGGGTDFRAFMEHIKGSLDEYAFVVFVTDGQTTSWGDDPGIPVLWAITDSQQATDKLKPPFGEKLCLYTR